MRVYIVWYSAHRLSRIEFVKVWTFRNQI